MISHPRARIGAVLGLIVLGAMAALYARSGLYGFHVFWQHGAAVWRPVEAGDPRLTPAMQLAMLPAPPEAVAGPMSWEEAVPGFDTAELPVIANGVEVDRILLARIDPRHFTLKVHSVPAGRLLDDWMSKLGAHLVINGSYFAKDGTPDTPVVSSGLALGPQNYDARHGAFVATASTAGIVDLAGRNWKEVLAGADDAMISYPMLIGADGEPRVAADKGWLANRSFVAEDHEGRIIVGTTRDAFFTLPRLARFLKVSPLKLKTALNLDGGPVACQAVAIRDFKRRFCGSLELAIEDGKTSLLQPVIPNGKWAMPIVLAVIAKAAPR